MDLSLDTFLRSELFTFIVHDENGRKRQIQVHADAISSISPALKNMMESPMSEGISKKATLSKDVDFDSFHRLCQFAYTRQYADPVAEAITPFEQDDLRPVSQAEHTRADDVENIWHFGSSKKQKKKGINHIPVPYEYPEATEREFPGMYEVSDLASRKIVLESRFTGLVYPPVAPSKWEVPSLQLLEFDYSRILIGHARVYSIAKYYMCESLCNLALYKLHAILLQFKISCSSTACAITSLIEYVFGDDDSPVDEQDIDPLQSLVTLYAATQTENLALAPQFRELLGKKGQFVRLYWKIICKDLLGSKEWKNS